MENRILAALPGKEPERLRPHLERVRLTRGQPVIVPEKPIRDFYFPLTCLLSLVTTMEDGASVESGTIGREGASGIPVLLDARQTTMPTFVQAPGEAVSVRADVVKAAYDACGNLHTLFNRYIHTRSLSSARTRPRAIVCTGLRRASASGSRTKVEYGRLFGVNP